MIVTVHIVFCFLKDVYSHCFSNITKEDIIQLTIMSRARWKCRQMSEEKLIERGELMTVESSEVNDGFLQSLEHRTAFQAGNIKRSGNGFHLATTQGEPPSSSSFFLEEDWIMIL
ncbi:hypothetical protein OS493_026373 [Desmophyllum pertusum]|uniref:Uncharacterized protein n=1 Tax=Desmophyllum pertusum TaxID=174260 RepID=A0A9W9Z9S5_9CNID|nr:hypothetical protein OS493_026373 [Desmophyllum pertusum]